jgi:hypothetical protein
MFARDEWRWYGATAFWGPVGLPRRKTILLSVEKSAEERFMRKHAWYLSLAILLMAAAAVMAADDAHMGTWVLNEGKSKISGTAKNTKVVYEAAGDSVKVTVDGVDEAGKALHTEWTGKFDGKEYAVTGTRAGEMRSYKKTGARSLALTDKFEGKVFITGKITVSEDGKSRTVAVTRTGEDGKKTSGTFVYDKQ